MRYHGTIGSDRTWTGSAIGTASSNQYREEAKRLADIAATTSAEAKVTLLETARLYEALAEHVEQRGRARG